MSPAPDGLEVFMRRRAEPGLRLLEASFWVVLVVLYALIVLRTQLGLGTPLHAALAAAANHTIVPAALILLVLGFAAPAMRRLAGGNPMLAHLIAGSAIGLATALLSNYHEPPGAAMLARFVEGALLYTLAVLTVAVYRATRRDGPAMVQLPLDLVVPDPPGPAPLAHLTVHEHGRTRRIPATEVSWIQAAGKDALVHAGRRVHRVRTSMRELERRLDPARFARVHRSRIVNLDHIQTIRPWLHGDYRIVMEDGTVVNFSRRYRSRLLHV